MDRRRFMIVAATTAMLGGVAVAVRAWHVAESRRKPLGAAWRAARRAGRPLLVLVIPAADRGLWERGTAFGEFLNFATDEQLAPLHRCDIACATMADVHVEFGTVPQGEPLMVLVEGGHAPQLRALDCHLVSDRDVRATGSIALAQAIHRASDARIATIAGVVRDAVGDPTIDVADAAKEVRERACQKPPLGARWAHSSGCGLEIEGAPPDPNQAGVACGMGMVPFRSARFLYFYSDKMRFVVQRKLTMRERLRRWFP